MIGGLISLACVCFWFGQAPVARQDLAAVLQLKYAKPSRVLATLKNSQVKLPAGIQSAMPDDRAMSLTVLGSPKGIDELKELLQLLDIVPHRVQLQVELLRIVVSEDGGQKTEVIASMRRRAVNNDSIQLDTSDPDSQYHLKVTPRVHGDGSTTLMGSCGISNDDVRETLSFANRIEAGHRTRVAAVTNIFGLDVQPLLSPGSEIKPMRPGVIYVLECTPQPEPR